MNKNNRFNHFSVGDRIYIEWGQTVFGGVIIEIANEGIGFAEEETEKFIS